MRLIISGGGTGGHVYPALSVVQELNRWAGLPNRAAAQPDPARLAPTRIEILWIGSRQGMEQELVERAGLKFEAISATGLRGKNPVASLASLGTMIQGYRQCRRLLAQFQPDVLLVTGGYVCVPVTLAARQRGIPIVIYLPDIEPGLAIKFLARLADRVAVTAPESQQFFRPGLTVVTGYPVRPELLAASQAEPGQARAAARRRLGLAEDRPVLLVLGGSQGARSINQAVTDQLAAYLEASQVIHVTGPLHETWVQARRAQLPAELQARYRVTAYMHEEMGAAFMAADLAISRAGASVLGEFPAVGLPAILVPYPYAGAHQALNASYLSRHGAAMTINDADLDRKLKDTVMSLITDKEKLHMMWQACRSLAQPEAAARLAQAILEVGSYAD